MKKLILILIAVCLFTGCSAPSVTSPESTTSSTMSITSTKSEPVLNGIDLYMKCFNEGKYDAYNLKLGDPIQNALNEYGLGEKKYYGLGADCYVYHDFVIAFVTGTESYENRVVCFDIIGKNITVFGLTTGVSTTDEVKKIFGEPEGEWRTGHYSYESYKSENYNEADQYFYISYSNNNENFLCHIQFFFDYGILKEISLCSTTGFHE